MGLPRTLHLKDGRSATVRRAEPRDAEAWISNVNAIGAEGVYLMTELLRRTVAQVRRQFAQADPGQELWLVAEVGGAVVGGANFARGSWRKNAHTAALGVAIRRKYRGLGLGLAMMQAGIAWAREVGITKLKLGVFATNRAALGLYRKLGFVQEGLLRGEVKLAGKPVDELVMARFLRRRAARRRRRSRASA
jgi:RimJ/RimL family protein N-acetyltransferase